MGGTTEINDAPAVILLDLAPRALICAWIALTCVPNLLALRCPMRGRGLHVVHRRLQGSDTARLHVHLGEPLHGILEVLRVRTDRRHALAVRPKEQQGRIIATVIARPNGRAPIRTMTSSSSTLDVGRPPDVAA